jgi:hypothetical protein
MPRPPKLAFVEKNSGMVIEEMLTGGTDPDGASLAQILELCLHYRRVGICRWFMRGDADALFTELANSAWVYDAWVQRHAPDTQCTSRCAPFIDAVVAGADAAAKALIAHQRKTWNEEREYEEDFYYARILHLLVGGPKAEIPVLLERWTSVSGGGEARHQICTALSVGDTNALDEGFAALLAEWEADAAGRRGKGDPDAQVTTDRLWLEGLALVKIARQEGLDLQPSHPALHTALLVPPSQPLPGPDGWKSIESHRDLD